MTIESHQVYEATPATTRRRLSIRRRLLSAPSGVVDGIGKPLVKSIIKVIPNGDSKKTRLFSTTAGIKAELQKTVIIKRLTTTSPYPSPTANSTIIKRPIIPLQSASRESPVADSTSDLRNHIVDSPHESLSHSEKDGCNNNDISGGFGIVLSNAVEGVHSVCHTMLFSM